MSALIVGPRGYLGSHLVETLGYPGVSLRDYTSIVCPTEPDVVINCAGLANLEECERDPALSLRANLNLVEALCRRFPHSRIVHFSSYYVYDHLGECDEAAPTTDRYAYTAHKLASERLVLAAGGTVLRLGKLFGHPDPRRQTKLTEALIRRLVTEVDRVAFNPTSLDLVAQVVTAILERRLEPGLYNVANSGWTNHADYAATVYQHLNRPFGLAIRERIDRNFHNYGRFLMSTNTLARSLNLNHWQMDLQRYIDSLRSEELCTASAI